MAGLKLAGSFSVRFCQGRVFFLAGVWRSQFSSQVIRHQKPGKCWWCWWLWEEERQGFHTASFVGMGSRSHDWGWGGWGGEGGVHAPSTSTQLWDRLQRARPKLPTLNHWRHQHTQDKNIRLQQLTKNIKQQVFYQTLCLWASIEKNKLKRTRYLESKDELTEFKRWRPNSEVYLKFQPNVDAPEETV